MEPFTIAALDLGSNSFHLVIARVEDDQLIYLDRIREHVCLAEGLGKDGRIDQEAQDRALTALAKIGQRLREIPPENIRVVGTNTLRAAKNSKEFIRKATEVLMQPISVIAGMEEARLIYRGVARHLPYSTQLRMVIDIGGGSTEMIIGHQETPTRMESLHMGCVTFSKRYFPKGRINDKSMDEAVHAVQRELQPFRDNFDANKWQEVIGASGTIKAVAGALSSMGQKFEGIQLEGMEQLARRLTKLGHTSKLTELGLKAERLPVFAGGFAVLYGLFKGLDIKEMRVSQYALREGLLIDILGRHQRQDTRSETVRTMMKQYKVSLRQAARVKKLALELLPQVANQKSFDQDAASHLLQWAACLHEMGLSVSHSGYHKHGAYLVSNADMPGFTKSEQEIISHLILNHRRKIRTPEYRFGHRDDWPLVLILRLACLFNRPRITQEFPPIQIKLIGDKVRVKLSKTWLDHHPLTVEDLMLEPAYWKATGIKFKLEPQ